MKTVTQFQDIKTEQRIEMITDQDLKRVLSFLRGDCRDISIVEMWEEKIEKAEIIMQDEAPPDLVTMNSIIRCGDSNFTLVFPREADIDQGRISILAPLGMALLGARVGQTISWQARDGQMRALVIDSISYQPEASGDWHL
ncbi:MAG TPA: GreA/GreB family elongation factor [Oligoflexus sp.]|uniref:GreA/GreB family elongation factor n=1 Tax=Oligoflexus sp. TaxID=1971216 RepID=UPI002D7EFC68|nr:GreA/GreB family elongation factor [Oligoflexus sp.]HET9235780.1 GreA/GreB family elongation factor [Oligoflexus sp.]